MIPAWQKRREEFNHKWLKNDLMMALGSWSKLLDGIDEDPETEKEFVGKYVKTWPMKQQEAAGLIDDFEKQMSPKTMFNEYPLSNCDEDTKKWLGDLVHQLWMVRCSVVSLVENAHASLRTVFLAHERLMAALKSCKDLITAREMKPFRKEFEDFRSACEKLGATIEKFPSDVLVA